MPCRTCCISKKMHAQGTSACNPLKPTLHAMRTFTHDLRMRMPCIGPLVDVLPQATAMPRRGHRIVQGLQSPNPATIPLARRDSSLDEVGTADQEQIACSVRTHASMLAAPDPNSCRTGPSGGITEHESISGKELGRRWQVTCGWRFGPASELLCVSR
jgi:hypothetical protein